MAGNKRLRFELNVLNVFNQKTARHIFNYLNRGRGRSRRWRRQSISANVNLDNGYDYNAMIGPPRRARTRTIRATAWTDLFEPGTQGQCR